MPTSIIDIDAPNTLAVTRDLAFELAATTAAVLDKREEKTRIAKKLNAEIKDLEKRPVLAMVW